jgi:hypothetical protein
MSSSVWEGVAATLIAAGVVTIVGYFVVGPKAAGVCLAVGVIIAIVLALKRRKKTSSTSAPPIHNSSTLTASPHIEQHMHFEYGERKPSEPQAKELQVQNEEIPSIAAQKPKEVLLHESGPGVWHEASTELARARKAIVVPFKNMPKPPGEHTPRASSVTASLVFRNSDNSDERHINHGVWLNHYEYFATINSGETQHLLVALKDVPFVTFENPNAHNPFGRRFRSGMVIHHPQKIALWTEGTVEIVLVDGRHVTLFNGEFDYKLSTEEMILTPKRLATGKALPTQPTPDSLKRRPHLTCISAVIGSIDEPAPGEFIEQGSNDNAIIVRFANDSQQGEVNAGTAVKALVAYLDGQSEISGTNGYWLEDFRDYASFRVDDRRNLLVGLLVKGELVTLHRNRVSVAINREAFPVEAKPLTNFRSGFLLVKLTDANNGDFLHEAKFSVKLNPLSISRIL